MSTIIMAQCWPMQGMSPAQKSVLISLADQASDDGVCWPAVGTIAGRTCLSERAVQDALKWLESHGAIRRERRNQRSTIYFVTPCEFTGESASGRKAANPAPVTPQMPRFDPANAAPGTVKEPSIEPSSYFDGTSAAPPKKENQQKRRASKKTASSIPGDFLPDETAHRLAGELNLDLAGELPAFQDHHLANDSKFADWHAALRTWLRNSAKFRQRRSSIPQQTETVYQRSMRELVQQAAPGIERIERSAGPSASNFFEAQARFVDHSRRQIGGENELVS